MRAFQRGSSCVMILIILTIAGCFFWIALIYTENYLILYDISLKIITQTVKTNSRKTILRDNDIK